MTTQVAGRQNISLKIAMLLLISAGTLLFVEFDLFPKGSEIFWLGALAALCCAPILIAGIHGRFDVFEPVYPVAFTTFIYFVLAIVALMRADSFSMLGLNYGRHLPTVIFLAFSALISFYITYLMPSHGPSKPTGWQPMNEAQRAFARRISWALLEFFALLVALWIVIGRIPLWSLSIFGQGQYNSWKGAAAGIQLGHLHGAQEALPACILLLIATRKSLRWPLAIILLAGVITFFFAALGVRARILLMVGSLFAYYFFEQEKRPTAVQILLMIFIVFYVIVGAIGQLRSPYSPADERMFITLRDAWNHFLAGFDIATTTAIYVHWAPTFGYDWGRQFLNILLTPIPAALWPDKYHFWGVSPFEPYLAVGSAAPVFVIFYTSFGPVGVVWGMAVLGALCSKVYRTYRSKPADPFAQITLALLWAYSFHVYGRHSVTLLVFGVLYVFMPVWIVSWLVTRRPRKRRKHVVTLPYQALNQRPELKK